MRIRKNCLLALAVLLGPVAIATAGGPDGRSHLDDSRYLERLEHQLDQRTLVEEVIARNAQIVFSNLQRSIAEDDIDRERAFYQPFWFIEGRYTDRKLQNTADDRLSSVQRLEQDVFKERRVDVETGLQIPVRTGADLVFSWSAVKRDNNVISLLSDPDTGESIDESEYTGGLNLVIRQPLLRGLGNREVEWQIQQAELNRVVTEQQFRQQLLRVSSEALNGYWQLYRLDRFMNIRRAALDNGQNIMQETRQLVRAGRQPQLAILEAEATILDRRSEYEAAQQAWLDAQTELKTVLNLSDAQFADLRFIPTDEPQTNAYRLPRDFEGYVSRLLAQWPGYLIAQKNREIEQLRVRSAREARRPQLDMSVGYSTSTLSYSRRDTYQDAFDTEYPTWFVGLEMRVPLGRNVEGRADERSAQARLIQAGSDMHFVHVSLANELRSRFRQLEQAHRDLNATERNRELYQEIYDAELERFNLGQARLRDLYEREDDLIRAEQRYVDALVRYQLSIVSLQLAEGSLFEAYDISITSEMAGGALLDAR